MNALTDSSLSYRTSSSRTSFEDESPEFLTTLMEEQGVEKKKRWRNNNSTLIQRAYVIDLTNLRDVPADIIRRIFEYNKESGERPLVVVPVAGWEAERAPRLLRWFPCFSRFAREQRLIREYAQSFSLSALTTAKNADVILRTSRAVQRMQVFRREGEYFFRVTAGVRITDADKFLYKKGLALPPNMPTLHVASLIGASANGSYGPGRDYGPMSTNIVEMKVINAQGKRLTLSDSENPGLFHALRDCHMGACYVREITLKNIQPKFAMRRRNILMNDVDEFNTAMHLNNLMEKEHFLAMYIPVDIKDEGDHCPRIRVTTFERTRTRPTRASKCKVQRNVVDYLNLMTAEAGEPLIKAVVESKDLRQYFPFILKTAALKTYGFDKETAEVDWSANIVHVFGTYTDLPITDINWLILVEDANEARDLLSKLFELTETLLKEYSEEDVYPLFNAFARFLKGVYYPKGEGGVAPTAVDHEHQSILSFEYVTYGALAKTKAFKTLVSEVVQFLSNNGYKYYYHPGKDWPDNVRSLTQIFNDKIGKQRLKNFKKAVYKLHGGKENIPFSPMLTPQKRVLFGMEEPTIVEEEEEVVLTCSQKREKKALQGILQLAKDEDNPEIVEKATKQLDC